MTTALCLGQPGTKEIIDQSIIMSSVTIEMNKMLTSSACNGKFDQGTRNEKMEASYDGAPTL